ncbi:proline--tRNA ligase [Cohnella sp. CFH 77786]|uniref:proline--tRNA ligase n=1 Tax=Cohnella sp. CFH 77786 TaxID=2662265 RepID=UPI001C60B127|nr:proline--tRNA ligase [Cohnella sp. CFH 77786]MBW5447580.1 proline--tRNA ligase [Cohnella sp. CFH 77786]
MKQSHLFAPTLREAPSDAEAVSHQWMLRAGFIRQLASGIYSYLPLGWRVLRKVERIIREEMDRAGAQEMLMPALQPSELWKESGRYDAYGPELIRVNDRHAREFALGPTHEEVVTALIRDEIASYRKLPVTLYQIQTKFRDEKRPRYGLLRGREFLMKDAYSFDASREGLDASYWRMYEAYRRIFQRCGLNVRAVEADAGAIGGEGGTHEFMALAEFGEDTVVTCSRCDYSANLEKAEVRASGEPVVDTAETPAAYPAMEKIHTPGARTIEQLAEMLRIEPRDIIKTIVVSADGQPVAVLIRGDHEVNEIKVKQQLGAAQVEMADAETVVRATGTPIGFVGPVDMGIPLLIDQAVARMSSGIAGANETDFHFRNVRPGRDFPLQVAGDYRQAALHDPCPRCTEGTLQFHRGIEVGHVFKLGTKYSEKLGAVVQNASGQAEPVIMGCYGIGVSRILSAAAEQHHDENGLIWPMAIAPFQVHLIVVSVKDETQSEFANRLYRALADRGIEVLMDDREERPGVKFKDADLFGIPLRLVVGKHAGEGLVEFKERGREGKTVLTAEEAMDRIARFFLFSD